jgi:O-antigen/teichoic acid export membrane protein
MPLAARLRAQDDHSSTRRLAQAGMLGAFIVCTPPAVMAAVYSYSILDVWMGPSVSKFWIWQSMMFIVPIVNVVISFGGSMLLADRCAAISLNKLSFLQVSLQLVLSLVLLSMFQSWSFVLGQVISVLLLVPFQLRLIRQHLHLSGGIGLRMTLASAACVGIGIGLYLVEPNPGLPMLIFLLGSGSVLGWVAGPFVAMDVSSRRQFFVLLRDRVWTTGTDLDRG